MALVKTAVLQQSVPIVDAQGRPTAAFLALINGNSRNLGQAVNALADLPEIREALGNLDQATKDAQDAADAARTATAANAREQALVNSWIEPDAVLSATPTTINVAAHTRQYADGTQVSVAAGTVPATASGDTDYVFYDDPERDGGAVAYQVATTGPAQTGDRHVVGAVTIPATGTVDGGEGPRRPGYVSAKLDAVNEQ